MTLSVIAVVDAIPEHQQAVRNALEAMLAPTRAEAGCLHYELHIDAENPCRLVMIERWRDDAALEEHFATAHIGWLQQTLDGKITNLAISRLNPIATPA